MSLPVISSIEDIKNLENVSSRVSEKYVPIKTSALVDHLKDFHFTKGSKYRRGSSAHWVKMNPKKSSDINVYIENSFDRTLSFRVRFEYENFIFGKIRQNHIGQNAIDIRENFKDFTKSYSQALDTFEIMSNRSLSINEMESIAEIIITTRGNVFKNVQGIEYSGSMLQFIVKLMNDVKEGELQYFNRKGQLKQLRKIKSQMKMIDISSKLWKYISNKYPELYF